MIKNADRKLNRHKSNLEGIMSRFEEDERQEKEHNDVILKELNGLEHQEEKDLDKWEINGRELLKKRIQRMV